MRSFISRATTTARTLFETTDSDKRADPLVAHYDALESHYLNSGVYERLAGLVLDYEGESTDLIPLKSLRNPAPRSVEFFAAKLNLSGWLEEDVLTFGDEAKPRADNIRDALRSVWKWSNWYQEGRVATRQYGWAGDLFVKVSTKEDEDEGDAEEMVSTAVFYERIDPRHVKDFDKDNRGNFTYLKISVPKTRRLPVTDPSDEDMEHYTQTEVWDKEAGLYRVYEHTDENRLGDPVETVVLSQEPDGEDEFSGYDFIPVKHAKFRDVGRDRGLCCFGHVLGNIRECDRIATKLHEMLFPDVTWVLQRSGVGPDGNPLPPIQLDDSSVESDEIPDGKGWARGYNRSGYTSQDNTIKIGRDKVARLPSGGSMEPKIPNRDMSVPANALAEQVKWVEHELPELSYSKLRELELSGRAIRYSLADVYDRYNEAFDNLADMMVQLDQMALTIGQAVGLEGFEVETIGEYGEDGAAFEHSFIAPDPFPSSRYDDAEAAQMEAQVLVTYDQLGLLEEGLIKQGYSEAEARALAAKAEEKAAAKIPSLDLFRIPDSPPNGNPPTGSLEEEVPPEEEEPQQ